MATFIFVAVAVIVAAGVAIGILSTVFHKAYVTVTPNTFEVNVQESVTAAPGTALPYQQISFSDSASKTVPATGTQHAENHASGTITVYNSFSTSPQRLITNTRFQTASGLVFRVHAPIVIPGYTMKAGVKVPGTVTTTVYADQAGDTYNVPASDFTLPGLKGTKQYQLIFAKSVSPMAGGFIGEQAVVDPAVRSQTVDALKAGLDRSIRAKIAAGTPAGSIVFNDTLAVAYTDAPDVPQGDNAAVVSVSGTASAPAFDEDALARQLASTANITYAGPLTINDPQSLSVSVSQSGTGTSTPITAAIAGKALLSAVFDKTALIQDLAGKDKRDIAEVLPKYPAISTVDVKVYPFWLSTLPGAGKIEVDIADAAASPATP